MVHGLAWDGPFPTNFESKLWKASVIVVMAAPGAGILLEITMKIPCLLHLDALARINLLVLSLRALRALPDGAYAQCMCHTLPDSIGISYAQGPLVRRLEWIPIDAFEDVITLFYL